MLLGLILFVVVLTAVEALGYLFGADPVTARTG